MLDTIRAATPVVVTIAVVGMLVLFRHDVHGLVKWIVSFRSIAKTREGYALVGGGDPELRPGIASRKEDLAISVLQPVDAAAETESRHDGSADNNWIDAFLEQRYDDAIALLNEGLEREPDKVGARSFIGHVYFRKNAQQGLEYFDALLREFPTSYEPYKWCALSLFWKDLFDDSLAVISRGMAVVSEKGPLLDVRSDVLRKAGRIDDAYEASLEGVRVSPTYPDNYLNLAYIEHARGQPDRSKLWFRRAIKISHAAEGVLAKYAAWLTDNGFHDEALLRYRNLVDAYPKNPEYRTLLGNAYLNVDLNNLALEEYLEATRLAQDKEGWILANIGNLYRNAKLYGRAAHYLRQAVELEPTSQYATDRLAAAMKDEQEQRKKCDELLDKVRAVVALVDEATVEETVDRSVPTLLPPSSDEAPA